MLSKPSLGGPIVQILGTIRGRSVKGVLVDNRRIKVIFNRWSYMIFFGPAKLWASSDKVGSKKVGSKKVG